jgi:ribosome-binding factor A
MKGLRGARLSGEYQKAIYEILSTKVKDNNLTEMFSILKCDVTTDLKHAKVYISIFSTNKEKRLATFGAIEHSAGYVRHELALIMRMRTVPELHFVLDDSLEYSDKINKLLHEIKKEEIDQ